MIDMRLALMEPTDLRGYPNPNPKTTKWSGLQQLTCQRKNRLMSMTLLYCSWMNLTLHPQVYRRRLTQLVPNGKIGQYKLPSNVKIVAAGNRETDPWCYIQDAQVLWQTGSDTLTWM